VIEHILSGTTLVQVDGTWVLTHNGREYLRLIDATSRIDAEQQIAEMLFLLGSVMRQADQEISRD
jgi:hypothetical protein